MPISDEGIRYGRLTVVGRASGGTKKNLRLSAVCDCGNVTEVWASNLRAGRTTSCGRHPRGHRTRSEVVGYGRAHSRIQEVKGKASHFKCADRCGRWASHWSYDYLDASQRWEVRNGKDTPYSLNPDHYQPRCASCHKHLDNAMGGY